MKQMPKPNYQLELDKTLKKITDENIRPKLLLHACCAPCSSYVLEYLTKYFDITVFFYNPNISPESEYLHRVNEIKRLISEMCPSVQFIEGSYRMRIEESAVIAKQGNLGYFTTTLSISPQKDSHVLNSIGKELSEIYDIPYLYSDFKKKGGYKRSIELSAEFHLYRQNFCGCIYSKKNAGT